MSGPGGQSGHGEINRLPLMRADPVCRAATALTLAPVLAFGMWAAAIAGTGTAWNYSQPGQTNLVGVVGGFAFSALMPAVVLVTLVRSRRHVHSRGIVNRVLLIEKWGLPLAIPLLLVSLVIVSAGII